MRQRRKKQNACLRLLCCLCNSIIEAEKGERSPPPPSPPRAIVRRPSTPPQEPAQPTIVGPRPPLNDDGREMTDSSPSEPPKVDDNGPVVSAMSLPRVENPEEDMRPVQPSGNGPWAGSNERDEVSAPGSGSGLSIPFDRPPDV